MSLARPLLLACLLAVAGASALGARSLNPAVPGNGTQRVADERRACNPAARPPLTGQRLELRQPSAAELAALTADHPTTETYFWVWTRGGKEERSPMAEYTYPLLVELAQGLMLSDPLYSGCRLLSREESQGATPVSGCQAGDPIHDLAANPTGKARFFFAFTSVVECQPPQSALPYEVNLLLKVSSEYETGLPDEFSNVLATWEPLANV